MKLLKQLEMGSELLIPVDFGPLMMDAKSALLSYARVHKSTDYEARIMSHETWMTRGRK